MKKAFFIVLVLLSFFVLFGCTDSPDSCGDFVCQEGEEETCPFDCGLIDDRNTDNDSSDLDDEIVVANEEFVEDYYNYVLSDIGLEIDDPFDLSASEKEELEEKIYYIEDNDLVIIYDGDFYDELSLDEDDQNYYLKIDGEAGSEKSFLVEKDFDVRDEISEDYDGVLEDLILYYYSLVEDKEIEDLNVDELNDISINFENYLDSKVGDEIESYEKVDFVYLINYSDNPISDRIDFEYAINNYSKLNNNNEDPLSYISDLENQIINDNKILVIEDDQRILVEKSELLNELDLLLDDKLSKKEKSSSFMGGINIIDSDSFEEINQISFSDSSTSDIYYDYKFRDGTIAPISNKVYIFRGPDIIPLDEIWPAETHFGRVTFVLREYKKAFENMTDVGYEHYIVIDRKNYSELGEGDDFLIKKMDQILSDSRKDFIISQLHGTSDGDWQIAQEFLLGSEDDKSILDSDKNKLFEEHVDFLTDNYSGIGTSISRDNKVGMVGTIYVGSNFFSSRDSGNKTAYFDIACFGGDFGDSVGNQYRVRVDSSPNDAMVLVKGSSDDIKRIFDLLLNTNDYEHNKHNRLEPSHQIQSSLNERILNYKTFSEADAFNLSVSGNGNGLNRFRRNLFACSNPYDLCTLNVEDEFSPVALTPNVRTIFDGYRVVFNVPMDATVDPNNIVNVDYSSCDYTTDPWNNASEDTPIENTWTSDHTRGESEDYDDTVIDVAGKNIVFRDWNSDEINETIDVDYDKLVKITVNRDDATTKYSGIKLQGNADISSYSPSNSIFGDLTKMQVYLDPTNTFYNGRFVDDSDFVYYLPCVECVVDWNCDGWSDCSNGKMTRTCVDNNECGVDDDKPEEEMECEEDPYDNPNTSGSGGSGTSGRS
jgi:hypothetical protein